MRLSAFAFLFAASAFTSPSLAATPDCPALANPPAPACRAVVHGWAYAPDEAGAIRAAEALDGAAADFQRYFDRTPQQGALLLGANLGRETIERFSEEHELGYVLVYQDAGIQRAMLEKALRQAMPDLDEAKLEAIIDQQANAGYDNTLKHELGHSMFAATFSPQDQPATGHRYGTPAPDWLDEAAAILMEADRDRSQREAGFLETLRTTPGQVPSLSEFLELEHPMAMATRHHAGPLPRTSQETGPRILAGPVSAVGTRVATFYGQSMMFANFLMESSANGGILGPISAALEEGSSFVEWIESAGAQHGLPASLDGLEAEWEAWLEGRLAQVAAAADG